MSLIEIEINHIFSNFTIFDEFLNIFQGILNQTKIIRKENLDKITKGVKLKTNDKGKLLEKLRPHRKKIINK